jgi:hypothetical protein
MALIEISLQVRADRGTMICCISIQLAILICFVLATFHVFLSAHTRGLEGQLNGEPHRTRESNHSTFTILWHRCSITGYVLEPTERGKYQQMAIKTADSNGEQHSFP